jgi:hypothetical protein
VKQALVPRLQLDRPGRTSAASQLKVGPRGAGSADSGGQLKVGPRGAESAVQQHKAGPRVAKPARRHDSNDLSSMFLPSNGMNKFLSSLHI